MSVVVAGRPGRRGRPVRYTLTATNAGNMTLTGVTIADPKLGTLECTPGRSRRSWRRATRSCAPAATR